MAAVGLGLIGPTEHLPETPVLTVYTLFLPSVAVGVLVVAAGLGLFGLALWACRTRSPSPSRRRSRP